MREVYNVISGPYLLAWHGFERAFDIVENEIYIIDPEPLIERFYHNFSNVRLYNEELK